MQSHASHIRLCCLLSLICSLLQGYILRDAPNVYLTALALASGPNLVGHFLGPLATGLGFWWASRDREGPDKDTGLSEATTA